MTHIEQLKETFWIINTETRITRRQFIIRFIILAMFFAAIYFIVNFLITLLGNFLLADMDFHTLLGIRLGSESPTGGYVFIMFIRAILTIFLSFFIWKTGKTLYIKRFRDMNYDNHGPKLVFNILFGVVVFGTIVNFLNSMGYGGSVLLYALGGSVITYVIASLTSIVGIILQILVFASQILGFVMSLMCIFVGSKNSVLQNIPADTLSPNQASQ